MVKKKVQYKNTGSLLLTRQVVATCKGQFAQMDRDFFSPLTLVRNEKQQHQGKERRLAWPDLDQNRQIHWVPDKELHLKFHLLLSSLLLN